MANRFTPPPPPGRALGASPGLDDSLLDEVNDYLGEVALNPPGPLSPKSERLKKMALAAKEAARRAAARVTTAETAAQEQRDNALRAQAQLDLLRDLHGRAANLHAGPAGGSAGSGSSSAPPAVPVPGPPTLFNSFLSSARPELSMAEMQGEVRRMQDREEERARGTQLRSTEALREDKAWVADQSNWGQVARSLQEHFQGQGLEVPDNLQAAVNRGESQATQCRQNLRLVERHGPRVAAEFQGTPLLSPEAHTRLRSICKDERQRLADLRVRTGSGVHKTPAARRGSGGGTTPRRPRGRGGNMGNRSVYTASPDLVVPLSSGSVTSAARVDTCSSTAPRSSPRATSCYGGGSAAAGSTEYLIVRTPQVSDVATLENLGRWDGHRN